jgi:hypothetical protein
MRTKFQLKSVMVVTSPMPACLFLVRSLAPWAMALCLATTAFASPVHMDLVGVGDTKEFGFYVGPYSGTMNGTPVDLFCVDFANRVWLGEQWDANLTPITAGADLSDTRFGSASGALDLYQQAAFLTLYYALAPTNQYADIQATIWQLFNSTAPDPSSDAWLYFARSDYQLADYGDFRIVTNTGPVQQYGQVQEFLIRTHLSDAPEPSTQLQAQEFLVPAHSSDAPEPHTQLLTGLALVATSSVCRKLRRAH